MTIHLDRQDDAFHMRATNALGQHADLDGAPDIGGHDRGLRPMQMVLASLGACSSIDVILILKKQRQQLIASRELDSVIALENTLVPYLAMGDQPAGMTDSAQ